MFDYIKLRYQDRDGFELALNDSEKFPDLIGYFDVRNESQLSTKFTKVGEVKFKVTRKGAEVSGSIHKHWNYLKTGKSHNYNDFKYSNLVEAIDWLLERMPKTRYAHLTKLEVGFNLELNEDIDDLIDNVFIMFKEGHYSIRDTFGGDGLLKRFVYSQFDIKVYNKGKQFGLDRRVLRFEVVLKEKRVIEKLGIKSVSDLKDKRNLRRVIAMVLRKFKEMHILDSFYNIRKEDRDKLYKYTNSLFWNYHIVNKSYAYKSKQRKLFNQLVVNYKLDVKKNSIYLELLKKYAHLINN